MGPPAPSAVPESRAEAAARGPGLLGALWGSRRATEAASTAAGTQTEWEGLGRSGSPAASQVGDSDLSEPQFLPPQMEVKYTHLADLSRKEKEGKIITAECLTQHIH